MKQFFDDNSHFDEFECNFTLSREPSKFPDNFCDRAFDISSTHSSYNQSKASHDYLYSDFDGSDKLNEDDPLSCSRSPNIMQKGIQKHHEPIVDNGAVYRYEDDPNEYKKARKRVQNRISATRVRNKKKTYVEELEGQLSTLKSEVNQLKSTNNVLSTENSLLKQQVSFFEKLFMNKNNTQPQAQPQENNSLDESIFSFNDTSLDIDGLKDETPSYYRTIPSNRIRKHTAFLGVMTVLLCLYGALTTGESNQISNISNTLFGGNNPMTAVTKQPRSFDEELDVHTPLQKPSPLDTIGVITLVSKLLFIGVYALYGIYVLTVAHKHYFINKASTKPSL
jgi:regulator of replication initiation timing